GSLGGGAGEAPGGKLGGAGGEDAHGGLRRPSGAPGRARLDAAHLLALGAGAAADGTVLGCGRRHPWLYGRHVGEMVSQPTVEKVMEGLSRVEAPELLRDLVSLNMGQGVRLDGGRVSLQVILTTAACALCVRIRADVEAALRAILGVTEIDLR